jgi:ParB family chromosome partitioning protein
MALGRGLSSLIPEEKPTFKKEDQEIFVATGEQVWQIPLEQIEPNPEQPRKNFAHLAMEELINSIKEYGIIQPLILTKQGENSYQIVAGERRWRAAKVLELKTVPSLIRSIKENEKLALSLLENIQRKDLNALEKAQAYQRLIKEFNLTQEEISQKLGKARASIANSLRILSLPEIIKEALAEEKITEAHAKALMALGDETRQKALLKRILGVGLTVKETENLVKGKKVKKRIELSPEILKRERILREILGTKVKISSSGGKNKKIKVVLEFYQEEELDELIKKIT